MFSRKFVEKIRFWSSLGRSGSSGKSRATRRQNSSLLRPLATTKTSKKRFGKKSIFWGFGNQFFAIWPNRPQNQIRHQNLIQKSNENTKIKEKLALQVANNTTSQGSRVDPSLYGGLQNSRFQLSPEVRERCKKSKKSMRGPG